MPTQAFRLKDSSVVGVPPPGPRVCSFSTIFPSVWPLRDSMTTKYPSAMAAEMTHPPPWRRSCHLFRSRGGRLCPSGRRRPPS